MLQNLKTKTKEELIQEIEELRYRLSETEETLEAIRNGEVDAIIVSGANGENIFSLTSAEKPYRVIIEEMEEGAVTLSEAGIVLYCNRRFSNLVSVPMEQIIGSNFTRFISENELAKYHELFKAGLSGRIKGETIFICREDSPVYLHLSFCALPKDMLGKVCIIVTDITELKKYQQDLQVLVDERTSNLESANLQLKETNATKDKLFSVIAHDLRGPFTSLLGISELLIENLEEYDINQFRTMLTHINSSAKSAFALLENLLIWARSQNKRLQFNPRDIRLTPLIKEVTVGLGSLASIKNIHITVNCSDDITGYADENMLKAIIRNLVANAIKFTRNHGSIQIAVSASQQQCKIMVSDNGVGMSEETMGKLFLVNSNATLEGTAHEKGTGLGLLLCQEFVEKHGGKISVSSKLGEGSKFQVALPYKLTGSSKTNPVILAEYKVSN